MKTIKLYDTDSYLFKFTATVLYCECVNDMYEVILDKTAFFPEGGGQYADKGTLNGIEVVDVQIKDDEIIHYTASPIAVGSTADGEIDSKIRFSRMQEHSGEHIVSGIAHSLYGCENVGFHLGDEVTVDFDIELNCEQINKIELLANEAVYSNLKITTEYPDAQTLKTLEYRSKLDLTDNVRIVTIDGIDRCACCAPHVKRTGEIGIIKILSTMRHRGGIRLRLVCGHDAYGDYCAKCENLGEIAVALCSKPNETAREFKRYQKDVDELKSKISSLKKELTQLKAKQFEKTDEIIVIFDDDLDMQNLRILVLEGAKFTSKICAGFAKNGDGYSYAISSKHINLRELSPAFNSALNGKGGGSAELIQGNVTATENEIRNYLRGEKYE